MAARYLGGAQKNVHIQERPQDPSPGTQRKYERYWSLLRTGAWTVSAVEPSNTGTPNRRLPERRARGIMSRFPSVSTGGRRMSRGRLRQPLLPPLYPLPPPIMRATRRRLSSPRTGEEGIEVREQLRRLLRLLLLLHLNLPLPPPLLLFLVLLLLQFSTKEEPCRAGVHCFGCNVRQHRC